MFTCTQYLDTSPALAISILKRDKESARTSDMNIVISSPLSSMGALYHCTTTQTMHSGLNLELINVISMILFPHDLLTPDADRTPCTPSLPRDRIKGMFIFQL